MFPERGDYIRFLFAYCQAQEFRGSGPVSGYPTYRKLTPLFAHNLEYGVTVEFFGPAQDCRLSVSLFTRLRSQSNDNSWTRARVPVPPQLSHLPAPKHTTHLAIRPCPVPSHSRQRPVPLQAL